MSTKKKSSAKPLVNLEETAKASLVLRSLNHKLRQAMLRLLHANKEMKVTDIYRKLKIDQSKASAFLGLLRNAGVVKTRREGQVIYYSVNYERIAIVEKGSKIINGKN
jgi:DNA-binding transcriptional ArsR family regulator